MKTSPDMVLRYGFLALAGLIVSCGIARAQQLPPWQAQQYQSGQPAQGQGQPAPAQNPPQYQPGPAAQGQNPSAQNSPPQDGQRNAQWQTGNQPQPSAQQYPTIERRPPVQQPPTQQPPTQQPAVYGPAPPPSLGLPYPQTAAAGDPNRAPHPEIPFVLSPQEMTVLDNVLNDWEKRNKEVNTVEADLVRWRYDSVFGSTDQQPKAERGTVRYTSPDKGLFKIDGDDPEQWVCNGKSVFEYNYKTQPKQVIEHRLPPEMQGKSISDGPLPFVFGAEAHKLKQRYFMKVITPPNTQGEVWLVAYPRFQQEAADFKKVELILKIDGMLPYAIQIFSPNGKDRTVYQLENQVVNSKLHWLEGNWYGAPTPFGWKKVVEEPPTSVQAGRAPSYARQ